MHLLEKHKCFPSAALILMNELKTFKLSLKISKPMQFKRTWYNLEFTLQINLQESQKAIYFCAAGFIVQLKGARDRKHTAPRAQPSFEA
jgi:hypothetical protein